MANEGKKGTDSWKRSSREKAHRKASHAVLRRREIPALIHGHEEEPNPGDGARRIVFSCEFELLSVVPCAGTLTFFSFRKNKEGVAKGSAKTRADFE